MNETSRDTSKLVSWAPGCGLALAGLGKGAQTAGANAHADGAISPLDGDLLHVELPAPPGVALRKAHAIAEQWPTSPTNRTLVGHVYPLQISSGWLGSASTTLYCTTIGTFLQTAYGADEVNRW
jgi:hypothetical protein